MITQTQVKSHTGAFRTFLESKGYAPNTAYTYSKSIRGFLIANPYGDEYNFAEIIKYFEEMAKDGPSLPTRKSKLIYLKKYYEYLIYSGHRNDHPCMGFLLKGKKPQGMIHSDLFKMEELERLLSSETGWGTMYLRNKIIVSFMVYQALTELEILSLKTTDIDLENGIVKLRKGRSLMARELELHPTQSEWLNKYINEERPAALKQDTDILILSLAGKPSNSMRHAMMALQGFFQDKKFNPSTIRESVISHWLNTLKLPVEQVQLMAGLRWVSSVERYTNYSSKEAHEMLKQFHPMGNIE